MKGKEPLLPPAPHQQQRNEAKLPRLKGTDPRSGVMLIYNSNIIVACFRGLGSTSLRHAAASNRPEFEAMLASSSRTLGPECSSSDVVTCYSCRMSLNWRDRTEDKKRLMISGGMNLRIREASLKRKQSFSPSLWGQLRAPRIRLRLFQTPGPQAER